MKHHSYYSLVYNLLVYYTGIYPGYNQMDMDKILIERGMIVELIEEPHFTIEITLNI